MENKLLVTVSGVSTPFTFESLENQFKFTRIVKEGEKKFHGNFIKKLDDIFKKKSSYFETLDVMEFTGEELLKLCTSHDFSSREKIETFFADDYGAFLELTSMSLGFMLKPFLMRNKSKLIEKGGLNIKLEKEDGKQ